MIRGVRPGSPFLSIKRITLIRRLTRAISYRVVVTGPIEHDASTRPVNRREGLYTFEIPLSVGQTDRSLPPSQFSSVLAIDASFGERFGTPEADAGVDLSVL